MMLLPALYLQNGFLPIRILRAAWLAVLTLYAGMAHAQKAFEVVPYTGTVQGRTLKLALANGYPNGSTLRVKNAKGAAQPYLPDPGYNEASRELRLVPQKARSASQGCVVLQGIMEAYDTPPPRLRGYFISRGRTYRITLYRQP